VANLILGIFLGWSAPAIPLLLQNKNLSLSSFDIAWTVSIFSLGESLSCLPVGMVRNRFGTKGLMVLYSVPGIIGWILLAFGINSWMVIF
jgi:MFS family permease